MKKNIIIGTLIVITILSLVLILIEKNKPQEITIDDKTQDNSLASTTEQISVSEVSKVVKTEPVGEAEEVRFEELKPLKGISLKIVDTNGLSLAIPADWKVSDATMAKTGIVEGLIITSADIVESARTENLIGDEQTIVSGIKLHVSYQTEEVVISLEDPLAYFEFITEHTGSNAEYRNVMIASVPMLISKNNYSSNSSTVDAENEWLQLNGRNAGKKVQIHIFYKGPYSDQQELLDGILASLKFEN